MATHHRHRRLQHPAGLFVFALASLVIACFALWKLGLFTYADDQGGSGTTIQHIQELQKQINAPER